MLKYSTKHSKDELEVLKVNNLKQYQIVVLQSSIAKLPNRTNE